MKKKRVGIITFHAAHNYGSMLQAYALQQTISNMDFYVKLLISGLRGKKICTVLILKEVLFMNVSSVFYPTALCFRFIG